MFPAIDPDDVATLTHAIDYLAEALRYVAGTDGSSGTQLVVATARCDSIAV